MLGSPTHSPCRRPVLSGARSRLEKRAPGAAVARLRRAVTLSILCLSACGPSPADPDAGGCGAGSGSVEVGAGGSRLQPLRDGDELPIVRGAQGGIHVLVGAWVDDMDLEMELSYRLQEAEGGHLLGLPTVLALDPGLFAPDGSRHRRHPDLIVLDDEAPRVDDFAGRAAELVVEARSADGSHACDRRSVVLIGS